MEREQRVNRQRKVVRSYLREPTVTKPRRVIGSYLHNGHSVPRPFHTWEIQAAEIWKRQLERENQPIVTKPGKVVGSYLRSAKAA